jgi:hypothetical protein
MDTTGGSSTELHLVPRTFTNNAGRCSPTQWQRFYLAEASEGRLRGRGLLELPQDEAVLPVDTCRVVVDLT